MSNETRDGGARETLLGPTVIDDHARECGNPRGEWGAYRRITETLRERVTNGTYTPGSRLPSESALCVEFGVTRNTVRRALSELQAENLVYARMGVGRFVRDHETASSAHQSRPRYERIAGDLRSQIDHGDLRPGATLPSEARIKTIYGVSRHTAQQALRELERAGLVDCIPGKGRFVLPRRP